MTDPVSATSGAAQSAAATSIYSPPATSTPSQTMDSSMFLQLLVTQLQNQDPSSPMDTDQMLSQTTQLAMMEQLTTLSSTQTEGFALQMRAAASELIGKQVSYTNSDGDAVSGTVSSVSFSGQVPTLTVGTDQIALDDLTGVAAPTA
ncbi:flagellar hook capping FlgD N-terminal domain-containing protein [Gryllotalpicola kribbensis]|jgi:flagellar basal-body rod modification protein FlgD|uniref:Flagellar hook capping FlgD N-terminal domain-containing protein n=1 Tax=Gryllotalpicola kribbensis TaxID=993084 RepID=A0ABP8ALL4_9MICO